MKGLLKSNANGQCQKPAVGRNPLRILVPPVIGMALCCMFLVGTSWAWFTDSATGNVDSLDMARFSCDITVAAVDGSTPPEPFSVSGEPISIPLYLDNAYSVTLTSTGTATTGYCIVRFMDAVNGEQVYYTDQIEAGGTFTFTYQNGISEAPDTGAAMSSEGPTDTLTIEARWGTPQAENIIAAYSVDAAIIQYLHNGDTIGRAPSEKPLIPAYTLENIVVLSETLEGDLYAVLKAADGYNLPEHIEVIIDETLYTVAVSDGYVPDSPWFDPLSGTLTIPESLLAKASELAIRAAAVILEATPTPEAAVTPEPALSPEPTQPLNPSPTPTPEAVPTPEPTPTVIPESAATAEPSSSAEPLPAQGQQTPAETPPQQGAEPIP